MLHFVPKSRPEVSHFAYSKWGKRAKSIRNPLRLFLTAIDDFETIKQTHGERKGCMNRLTDAKKGIKSRW